MLKAIIYTLVAIISALIFFSLPIIITAIVLFLLFIEVLYRFFKRIKGDNDD